MKIAFLCFVFFMIGMAASCMGDSDPVSVQITIASEGTPATNAYTKILEEEGYYYKYRLLVNQTYYPTNKEAADSVISGKSDFAIINTYGVADLVLRGEKPVILTSVARFDDVYYLVIDKKSGIQRASDLKGKRIGLVTGDFWEYYLDRYLLLGGLAGMKYQTVPLPIDQIGPKMLSGEIDAGLTIYQTAVAICRQDPERYRMWSVNNNENFYYILISSQNMVSRNPDAIERLFGAVNECGEWYGRHQEAAEAKLSEKLGIPLNQAMSIMPGLSFDVNLKQGLLTTLESQSGYIIEKNREKYSMKPDFLQFINFTFLDAIRPEGDAIIHE